MSKYTIELRKVCDLYGRNEVENWFSSYNLSDFLTSEQIEVITTGNVWSKEKLAKKIVDHYFMREIGFETPYLFRHYAITTMNEIMEEYLLKIYSKFLQYDPLSSVDYVEEYTREIENTHNDTNNINTSNNTSQNINENVDNTSSNETSSTENITGSVDVTSSSESTNSGSSQSTSNSSSSSLNLESDTPQGRVTKQDVLDGVYASKTSYNENESNVQDSTSTTNTTTTEGETTTTTNNENNLSSNSSSEGNTKTSSSLTNLNNGEETAENNGGFTTTEKYTHSMKGDNGVIVTNQYLVREFRELAKSFDLEIIEKLNTLFMGIY